MSVAEQVSRLLRAEIPCPRAVSTAVERASAWRREILIGLCFGIAGIPALIYQVAWQRILTLHVGVGSLSVATIVAGYLAGLGLGNLLGGLVSLRRSPRTALVGYAALEIAMGLFGLISVPVYHRGLAWPGAWLFDSTAWMLLVHFLALLPPTILMGMTLPMLVRGVVDSRTTATATIARYYGANVLGAAIGGFACPWLLIPFLGVPGAVAVAAGLNLAVGIGVVLVNRFLPTRSASPTIATVAEPSIAADREDSRTLGLWLALSTASGFLAIGLEIVWFRMLDVAVKATAFTFGTILGWYLIGLGLGSYLAAGRAGRVRSALASFLVAQTLILLIAGGESVLIANLPETTWGFRSLWDYWASYEPIAPGTGSFGMLVLLYGVLPLVLFGVPTLLMGYAFVIVQTAIQQGPRSSGFRVGLVQFGNVVGCTSGSLAVGLWGLSRLGTPGTIRLLMVVGLAFPVLGFVATDRRRAFAGLSVVLTTLAVCLPRSEPFWSRLHGQQPGVALIAEDETGVVAIAPEPVGGWRLSVNGKGQSHLPFGGIHSRLGVLASMVHPDPQRIGIIGLGSGDTAWAAACRSETLALEVFELCPSQLPLLHRLNSIASLPDLDRLLRDPRIHLIADDGRHAIRSGPDSELFDVIEADAIRPNGGYSGNLYSVEFFQTCSGKLRPGGLLCSWAPTPRVASTIRSIFPHLVEFSDGAILIGSNEPIAWAPETWRKRLHEPEVVDYLGQTVIDDCDRALATGRPSIHRGPSRVPINQDLYPWDEFGRR